MFGGTNPSPLCVVDRGLRIFTLSTDFLDSRLTEGLRSWSHVTFRGWDQQAPYGHTLNHIGSRLYVFGGVGQTIHESKYATCLLDDFISFDLLKMDKPDAGWEPIETDQKPSERSGHTCVSLSDAGPLVLYTPPQDC